MFLAREGKVAERMSCVRNAWLGQCGPSQARDDGGKGAFREPGRMVPLQDELLPYSAHSAVNLCEERFAGSVVFAPD